jgi:hypothetical protein
VRSANFDAIEWKGHASHRTKAGVSMKRLLQGVPGPTNYELTTVRAGEDYTTPRHRHNFEQFMYVIDGRWEFGVGDEGAATNGMLGWIPEGSYYGPQRLVAGSYVITLQFGGASGLGFLAYEEWYRAQSELSELGAFEAGKYVAADGSSGDGGQDAFEAIWEHVNGRKVEYPQPRYSRPFAINPDAFAWEATPYGARKSLGTFTERAWSIGIHRWDRAEAFGLGSGQATLAILLGGSAVVDGTAYPALSAFELQPGERVDVEGESGTTALVVTMANFQTFVPSDTVAPAAAALA